MSGDTRSGQFSGLISGTYEISDGVAIVTIRAKPFFVSWETIEQQLLGFLGG